MKSRLEEVQPHEVSLVARAANRRTFLALKSEGGDKVSEVLDAIMETEAENEGAFLSVLKTAGVPDDAAERMLAGYRLFNADRENLNPETFASLAGAMGFSAEADPDNGTGQEGIIKADGTINAEAVPDELKGTFEAIQKAQETLRKENEILRERVEKREQEELLRTYTQKSEELSSLPTDEGFAEALMGLAQKAPEEFAVIDTVLTAANAAIEKGALFERAGRPNVGAGSVYGRIEAMAKERVAKSAGAVKLHAAREMILDENPELQEEYLKEMRNG
jgi:hypothetical protein